MGIFLIFLLIVALLWPYIVRLLRRYMAGRAEDMMRRMAGMPSRKEERRRARRNNAASSGGNPGPHSERRRHSAPSQDAASIMKDVAEDVEFTEIREFESESILEEEDSRRTRRIYREEQVSDAEYTEIRTKRMK